jgi:RNA polymerase sigma-70 factor, ECF subfamily
MRVSPPPLLDQEAFSNLFSRTHLIIYRFIYGIHGGPVEEVEDITCDTYFKAWKARASFSGDDHDALCWLFTIARRLVIDAHRRNMAHSNSLTVEIDSQELQAMLSSSQCTPEEQVSDREQFIQIWQALQNLADEKREIIVLRYMLGWKVKEIAELLGKEENTISVIIRRCMDEIRDIIRLDSL